MSIGSQSSDSSDVRDDVFMGYNVMNIIKPIQSAAAAAAAQRQYKVEVDDISDDEIDQVVPTQSVNGDDAADDNNSLDDVIVLYVN